MVKGTYRLSLVEYLNDTGFYKAIEECVLQNDTIEEIESLYNQVSSAILSATKYALQLPLAKYLVSLSSFKSLLVPGISYYLHKICIRHYDALSRLLYTHLTKSTNIS